MDLGQGCHPAGRPITGPEPSGPLGKGFRRKQTRRNTGSPLITAPSAISSAASPRRLRRDSGSGECHAPMTILRHKPDGVFLSNGPGDPAATGAYAVPVIRRPGEKPACPVRHLPWPSDAGLALGGRKTTKMPRGHRGANHPVKDPPPARWEITSQNHGFEVMADSLPRAFPSPTAHCSTIRRGTGTGRQAGLFRPIPIPEASPGPQDTLPVPALRRQDRQAPTPGFLGILHRVIGPLSHPYQRCI